MAVEVYGIYIVYTHIVGVDPSIDTIQIGPDRVNAYSQALLICIVQILRGWGGALAAAHQPTSYGSRTIDPATNRNIYLIAIRNDLDSMVVLLIRI